MSILRTIGGWIFVICLTLQSWVGSPFFMLPTLLLLPFSQPLYRSINDWYAQQFFTFSTWVLENLLGMKFIITGDTPPSREECFILMSNHRTRTDWIFVWGLYYYLFSVKYMKIALKYPLKYAPGFGWACQMFCFLFLKRDWQSDQGNMTSVLGSWGLRKYPAQLLYFCEGTDLSPGNLKRSHLFAEKKGLQKYNYVLHPRTTGFVHCFNQLKGSLDAVYDVTIGYPDLITTGEKQLLTGQYPYEIHFHVKRYGIEELEDEDMTNWCTDVWAEKEERLQNFYEQKKSFSEQTPFPHPPSHFSSLFFSFSFWTFYFLGVFLPLFYSSLFRWYFLFGNVVYFCLSYFTDLYNFEVWCIQKQFGRKDD